jgi:tetratricopeptide (TPR) repeat protein
VRRNAGYEEARQYYQGALADNPTSAAAQYGLAEIALHEGQWADAATGFQSALAANLAPRALAQSGLAWADYQQGNLVAAQSQIEDAVRSLGQTPFFFDGPSSAVIYARLGWIAYRQQRTALAQRAYQRALELDASNADANFGAGLISLNAKDYANAVQSLSSGIRLGFEHPAEVLAAEIVSLKRCDDVDLYSQALNLVLATTCPPAR